MSLANCETRNLNNISHFSLLARLTDIFARSEFHFPQNSREKNCKTRLAVNPNLYQRLCSQHRTDILRSLGSPPFLPHWIHLGCARQTLRVKSVCYLCPPPHIPHPTYSTVFPPDSIKDNWGGGVGVTRVSSRRKQE
jgi:hypothetical protein